ncbi:hypothetical protein [Streptomyces sp. FIT100]|uniref:hypothetical protein n=1 Tax=Streptomyces sp. FIT100 TaxID=2837956 RepID=UPI0021C87FA9|nr:hypothetical protein [Streptomyces sp. FIT100]UUN26838.1 hypothetical protein KK483_10770 [Streptomyces sp. FIT100]
MRRTRLGIGTAIAAGALAVTGLAFAPTAMAVMPATATATYDCGFFGGGTAQLDAVQSGSSITITVTTAVTTPLPIQPGDAATTLRLALNGSGQAVFSGSNNPQMDAGDPYNSGPLTSSTSFVTGDSLDSLDPGVGPGLSLTIFGTTVDCDAVTDQSAPFVAS